MRERNTFHKEERLCGKLRIANLYKEGKHYTAYPIRVTYRIERSAEEGGSNLQRTSVLVWAPKSRFKHAVVRNNLRRLMREAYRLHAHSLRAACEEENCCVEMAFNYVAPTISDYGTVVKSVCRILSYVESKMRDNNA